jgi:hypothetical protein
MLVQLGKERIMKKIPLGQYVFHFASMIVLSLFSSSIMASTEYAKSLTQLSFQVDRLDRQLQTIQRQVNKRFTTPRLLSLKKQTYLPSGTNTRRGRNKSDRSRSN